MKTYQIVSCTSAKNLTFLVEIPGVIERERKRSILGSLITNDQEEIYSINQEEINIEKKKSNNVFNKVNLLFYLFFSGANYTICQICNKKIS